MNVKEAYSMLNEEINIAELHGDYEYADILKEIRDKLPLVEKDLKRNYGRAYASVLHAYVLGAMNEARRYARRIAKTPMYLYATPFRVLMAVDSFARRRRYRYGLNIEYVPKRVNAPRELIDAHVELLKRRGLVFEKHWKGRTYILPTKKGREEIERVRGR